MRNHRPFHPIEGRPKRNGALGRAVPLLALLAAALWCFGGPGLLTAQTDEPARGFKIVLSVYSGRPNPTWWITEGPEFERLVGLLKGVKGEETPMFKYEEWNRLGYASLHILPKGIEGMPFAVHVWRDKAVVFPRKEGKGLQSVGGGPIYDLLVESTAAKPHRSFFQNYLKAKAEREEKEKPQPVRP